MVLRSNLGQWLNLIRETRERQKKKKKKKFDNYVIS